MWRISLTVLFASNSLPNEVCSSAAIDGIIGVGGFSVAFKVHSLWEFFQSPFGN
jgi:hypothetical protein